MAGLVPDLRSALRQLRRTPGFTAAAILLLGLGICANSTAFSWIEGTLLNPIPGARDTGRLVSVMRGVWSTSPSPPLSYPDYRDLRDTNRSFNGLLAYHHDWLTLTGGDTPQRIYVANVSDNYFSVLGIHPLLGRFFLPGEESRPGGTPEVILGESLWRTLYHSDPAIVGESIQMARHPVTVIGVAPTGFIGAMPGVREDAWLPLDPLGNDGAMKYRDAAWLNVMGRLRPGVSRQQATQDLQVLMQRIVAEYPADHGGVNTIALDPLWRSPFGANGYLAAFLPILLAIAGVVLLLTCANVATLALVRFVGRRREIGIRQALGAPSGVLLRQMILEGFFLSLGGGLLAIGLTLWTSKILGGMVPPNASPLVLNGSVDAGVLVCVLLLSVLATLLCGALPAWRSSRIAPAEILKEEASSHSGAASNRSLLSGLVMAQVALSLALLVAAGLLLRTLRNTRAASPGFDASHVITASVDVETAGYSDAEVLIFQRKLLTAARNLPGVQAAALTDWLPFSYNRKTADAWPEGYVPQLHESGEVRRADVTAGYFDSMRIPIPEGRAFTDADSGNAPLVVIVDQTAARHYWPGKDPIGQRLRVWNRWYTVVGVAGNTGHQRIGEPPEPMIYMSFFQGEGPETILQVRTLHDPSLLAPALETAVHQVDPRLMVFDVRTLRETMRISDAFERMETGFASIFALLALILAASGIYGVVAWRTQLRTHEIGIRMALGAARGDVLRLIVFQGLRLAAFGLAAGIALSFALTRYLRSLLYGVDAADPFTLIAVTALLVLIAALACWLPALRAARMDPVAAIREL